MILEEKASCVQGSSGTWKMLNAWKFPLLWSRIARTGYVNNKGTPITLAWFVKIQIGNKCQKEEQMSKTWEKIFSTRADRMQSSAIRDLLKISSMPGVISFAGGMPSPDAFPIERFIEASQKILREQGDKSLQYSTTDG